MAQSKAAYIVYAEAHICECTSPRKELSTHSKLERAIPVASGHWALYLGFWGNGTHWLDIIIVDTRDGVIEWKNGKPTRETGHGESHGNERARAGTRDSGSSAGIRFTTGEA